MDGASREKVKKAGFVILRPDDSTSKPIIKYLTETFGAWKTHEAFRTKSARDAELKRLVQDETSPYILD